MKYRWFIACIVLGMGIASADPGFMISIRPGSIVDGFDIGARFGGFVPAIGLDYGYVTTSYTNRYEYIDTTYEYEGDLSMSIFVPHVGFRYLFGTQDVKPFFGLNFLYTFGSASTSYNGEEDTLFADQVGDLLSGNWGLGVLFGGEYFFAKHFSLGGCISFRYFAGGTSVEYGEDPRYLFEDAMSLGMSMASWSLNFYF
jgi:hypothetical protein